MQKDILSKSDISHEVFSDPMDDDYASSLDDYAYHAYHDDHTLYHGDGDSTHDQWDWSTGPYTPVPGFGYFSVRVKEELDHMTQVGILHVLDVCSDY